MIYRSNGGLTRLPRIAAASVMTILQVSQKSFVADSSCARMRRAAAFATRARGSEGTVMLEEYSWFGRHAPKLVQIVVGSRVSMYANICSPAEIGRQQIRCTSRRNVLLDL